jgi:hypothetical protein
MRLLHEFNLMLFLINNFYVLIRLNHIQLKKIMIVLKYMEYPKIQIQKIIFWFFNVVKIIVLNVKIGIQMYGINCVYHAK